QRIEGVADALPPTHDDAERHTDHDRGAEPDEERHRRDGEIVEQVAAVDQVDKPGEDQARLGDEQRVERHEQKDRLPGGEEQHDGETAEQHLAVTRGEGRANGCCLRHQTTISSLSVFQISSFKSLNSGVTRISYSRGRGSLMAKIFLARPGRLLITMTRSER